MRIDVLGALRVFPDGDTPGLGRAALDESAPLGGPRQRSVLASLLIARGAVVSCDRLIDNLWRDAPPNRPLGVLQVYVSNLRRILEPGRRPRGPAMVIRSAAPGYVISLPPPAVDAWQFETLLEHAETRTDPAAALTTLDEALGLWRGDPYAEVSDEPWARAEVARLDGLRVLARQRWCAALLGTGQSGRAVLAAESLASTYPLQEESWRLLALSLYAAGRQTDALNILRDARTRFVDELGLSPGPILHTLESDILNHRVELGEPAVSPIVVTGRPDMGAAVAPSSGTLLTGDTGEVRSAFVGRDEDLTAVQEAASAVQLTHSLRLVAVSGEIGAGKSALLSQVEQDLAAQGWLVVQGGCAEVPGGAPVRAWSEIAEALAGSVSMVADGLGPLLRDPAPPDQISGAGNSAIGEVDHLHGRAMLGRALVHQLNLSAAESPLAVFVEDLHGADETTAALLSMVTAASSTPVLVVVTYRPEEMTDSLAAVLAAAEPGSTTWIDLVAFRGIQAEQLVERSAGATVDPSVVTALVERTGGNALYLTLAARLLASEGPAAALQQIPTGVTAVLRHRLSRFGSDTVDVFRLAAVIGRDVELEVLTRAARTILMGTRIPTSTGDDAEDSVFDAVEIGVVSGLFTETAPGLFRFTHVLVRDGLYADIPVVRRARWHTAVAAALETSPTTEPAALAHHYYLSGTAAGAHRARTAATAAADDAMARYAPETAVTLYGQALRAHARIHPRQPTRDRVELLIRLSRAELGAGAGAAALTSRSDAARSAEQLGDPDLLVQALTAWTLPTAWTIHTYGSLDRELTALYERALELPSPPTQRCRLLCGLVQELAGHDQKVAAGAAAEAEALARDVTDPALLGLALHARAVVLLHDSDVTARLAIAEELLEIGRQPRLAVFAFLGHEYMAQWAATYAELDTLEEHLEHIDALVTTYRWRQAEAIVSIHRGLLAHLLGDLDEARQHYQTAITTLRRNGGLDVDRIAAIAFFTLAHSTGRLAALEPLVRSFQPVPVEGIDLYAAVLAAAGHHTEAEIARTAARPIPADFFQSLMLCIRAIALTQLHQGTDVPLDPVAAEEVTAVHAELAQFDGQVGGAITGAYTLGPVDTHRTNLSSLLNQRQERPTQAPQTSTAASSDRSP